MFDSYGIVMWEIVARRVPYEDREFEFIVDVKDAVLSGVRPTLPQIAARDNYVDLMRQCWSGNPDERPSFSEIVARLQQMRFAESGRDRSDELVEMDESIL